MNIHSVSYINLSDIFARFPDLKKPITDTSLYTQTFEEIGIALVGIFDFILFLDNLYEGGEISKQFCEEVTRYLNFNCDWINIRE